jgi:FkbM family methyltransferase
MADPVEPIDRLVSTLDPRPVLVDVGASAETPHIWLPFARHSTYVGFDPDLREMRETNGGNYHKAVILNEAVTAGPEGQVTFYLTRYPQCSSTLTPNPLTLDNYLGRDRFTVEREVTAAATTLNAAIDRLGLGRIDWLKVDSQGTDLRIINSLRDDLRSRLLAVDTEPGLRGAYVGEDLFSDVHGDLVRQGFWLSNANIKGFPRVRESTLAAWAGRDPGLTADAVQKAVRRSPGWVECRYFRSVESLGRGDFTRRDYVALWAFALADGQTGFAADVALEYDRRFGQDDTSRAMSDAALAQVRQSYAAAVARQSSHNSLVARVGRKLKRTIQNLQIGGGGGGGGPKATRGPAAAAPR